MFCGRCAKINLRENFSARKFIRIRNFRADEVRENLSARKFIRIRYKTHVFKTFWLLFLLLLLLLVLFWFWNCSDVANLFIMNNDIRSKWHALQATLRMIVAGKAYKALCVIQLDLVPSVRETGYPDLKKTGLLVSQVMREARNTTVTFNFCIFCTIFEMKNYF